MRKKLISPLLLSLLGALSVNSAFAQSSNFEGVSLDIGISTSKNKGETANTAFDSFQKTGTVGILDVGYNQALNNDWLIGVGATYDTNKSDFGSTIISVDVDSYSASSTFKNHYSVYIKPMYAVTDRTAVYAKLGYHSGTYTVTSDTDISASTSSARLHGLGYSLGVQHMLGQNLYIKAEAQFIQYSSKDFVLFSDTASNIKPSSTTGIIAIGYKF